MPHLAWFAQCVRKKLFRRNWPEESDAQKHPCLGAKWQNYLFAQFVRKTYFATIGYMTLTIKNSPVLVQNGPFDLFGSVCGKEVIRRICSGRLRKAKKAVFRCKMAHSTWFAQFLRKIISPHLASNAAKRPNAVFKCTMPTSTWIAQFVSLKHHI